MKNQPIHGRGAQISIPNSFNRHHYEKWLDDLANDEEREALQNLNPKTKILEVFPKTIVNKVESPDLPMNWSLNPYQGCEHGCIYCYARNSHEYWGFGAGLEFESNIMIKKNAPELLRDLFNSKKWKPEVIVMAGNTDIYQPIERKFEITRSLLGVFLEYKHPVGLITKNALILRDLDLLSELSFSNLVHVNLTLNTLDEHIKRVVEPRTSSVKSILKTIEKLSEHEIPVRVMAAPIIPGINDSQIMKLVETIASAGADDVVYEVVRLNGHIGSLFTDWIYKTFPDRAEKVLNQIKSLHGGTLNNSDYGLRMRGEGPLADLIKQQFSVAKQKYLPNKSLPEFNFELFEKKRDNQMSLF